MKEMSAFVMVGGVQELDGCSPIVRHITQLRSLILTLKNTIHSSNVLLFFKKICTQPTSHFYILTLKMHFHFQDCSFASSLLKKKNTSLVSRGKNTKIVVIRCIKHLQLCVSIWNMRFFYFLFFFPWREIILYFIWINIKRW